MHSRMLAILVTILLALISQAVSQSEYYVGVGSYDITGPALDVGMMGYAMMDQKTYGIHFRLRARAFCFSDGKTLLTFVHLDTCMASQAIKTVVLEKLAKLYPSGPNGTVFTDENLMLSGSHTHAGPGGYHWNPMYLISTLGWNEDNFNAITNGIVKAIQQAYEMLNQGTTAKLLVNSGILLNTNINRSPTAYQANPASEKAKYQWDTDKEMVLLKLQGTSGPRDIGTLNWFPVHPTSMTNKNGYISGDNKGYAEYAFERYMNGNTTLTGTGKFVAAFAQSNAGDVSPNTRGAFCDDGTPCEVAHSTCGGFSQGCHGYGPGKDEFESTQIIGENQFLMALQLYKTASKQITGPLRTIFTYVNMESVQVDPQWTGLPKPVTTCKAALGDSFAAGTTDGPGEFNFVQGTNDSSTNEYWNWISHNFLAKPSEQDIACHYPKPILLFTGGLKWPADWTQGILPLQIFQLGNFYIVGLPAEFNTMAGRRLRETVYATLAQYGVKNATVVLSCLSNAYSHYVSTPSEYSIQRYEGASTLFGPYTLPAYQQEIAKLTALLAQGKPAPPGPKPADLRSSTFSLLPPVVMDEGNFGKAIKQPAASYRRGDMVEVVFESANPRNNLRIGDTFLTVEIQESGNWRVVYNDGDWCTRIRWRRVGVAGTTATIQWYIPQDAQPGTYRIKHFGDAKDIFGDIKPFQGTSNSFVVNP